MRAQPLIDYEQPEVAIRGIQEAGVRHGEEGVQMNIEFLRLESPATPGAMPLTRMCETDWERTSGQPVSGDQPFPSEVKVRYDCELPGECNKFFHGRAEVSVNGVVLIAIKELVPVPDQVPDQIPVPVG